MSSIKIDDYMIDQAGLDWQTMLSGLGEVLPPTFTIWLVNRLGNVFIVPDDGAVYLLDISGGTFSRLAQSREEFADPMDVPQNANNWFMICSSMSVWHGACRFQRRSATASKSLRFSAGSTSSATLRL